MDVIFRKLSVIFLGIFTLGYGYYKNEEKKRLDENYDRVLGKIVNYEENEDGYGRYIYEYKYNEIRYRSGFEELRQKGKKEKVESKFGTRQALYCNKKNPQDIRKVNDYVGIISILGGILIMMFAVLFV